MVIQSSRSKVHVQSKNVSYSMDTPIKRLNFGMGRSVHNLSLGQKHVNPSVKRFFGLHSDFIWCEAVLGRSLGRSSCRFA